MAAFKKSTICLVVLVCVMITATSGAKGDWVRVEACDEVCDRVDREKDQCCRSNVNGFHINCSGGQMICESG